jgi:L-lactate dehydrogenase complex protein LldF
VSHGLVTPGRDLHERARRAVADPQLQRALRNLDTRLHTSDDVARTHQEAKHRAASIRRETLSDLSGCLDTLEASLTNAGAVVHRCATPSDARAAVLGIMESVAARRVIKGKSMATEEIDLNDAIEASGARVVETDLGEFIVQVAGERPSHMITPAIHKTLAQIAAVLEREAGEPLPVVREELTAWARTHLRADMLAGDLGITGVNFAVAQTGTLVVVTNEGNGRFCSTWPRVHVAVMTVEKVIRNFDDLATLLPLLTMSATGQRLSNYVTMLTGPRRAGELDGPDELHVVVLDHGRTAVLGTPYEEMLACVRCGACLNVCPVYRTIGGHAYDAVYPGPMGSVLTPLLSAGGEGADLPAASSLCGACSDACPVEIPLADLLVRLRADRGVVGATARAAEHEPVADVTLTASAPGRRGRARAWDTWARLWSDPRGYTLSARLARLLTIAVRGQSNETRWCRRIPGLGAWTDSRDLPVPAAQSFRSWWSERNRP